MENNKKLTFSIALLVCCICSIFSFFNIMFTIHYNKSPATITQSQSINVNQGKEKINLNDASLEMIDSLPGVGSKLAPKIKELIEKEGPLKDVWELSKIKGISQEKIRVLESVVKCK